MQMQSKGFSEFVTGCLRSISITIPPSTIPYETGKMIEIFPVLTKLSVEEVMKRVIEALSYLNFNYPITPLTEHPEIHGF